VSVRGLGNRFLTYIHDDGWFLKAYYRDWVDAEAVLVKILPALLISSLEAGDHAVWLKGDSVKIEEKTFDVDKIINRNL